MQEERGQWRERREREEGGTKTGGKKDNHTKRGKFSEENSEVPADITLTRHKEMLLISLTQIEK